MTDLVALFNQALAEFGSRVHRVGADQWSARTPCSEWDVGALVDHVIDEQVWARPLMSGHDLEVGAAMVASEKQRLGANRVDAWDAASLEAREAFGELGALDRQVTLSRGPTPAADYLADMIIDVVVHSWDLGRAIGVTDALPDDLVNFALAGLEPHGDLSATGLFDAPVPLPDGASAEDRLVALTGRRPR
jgi:uncharacterized protein (TIGR03086 family)